MGRHDKWTDEDLKLLQKHYPTEGRNVAARFPNRTVKAVVHRAHLLHLISPNFIPWTDAELDILSTFYTSQPLAKLKQLIPNRTEAAIYKQAERMRLKKYTKKKP